MRTSIRPRFPPEMSNSFSTVIFGDFKFWCTILFTCLNVWYETNADFTICDFFIHMFWPITFAFCSLGMRSMKPTNSLIRAVFRKFCDHSDDLAIEMPNHSPKINDCSWHWSLCRDVSLRLLIEGHMRHTKWRDTFWNPEMKLALIYSVVWSSFKMGRRTLQEKWPSTLNRSKTGNDCLEGCCDICFCQQFDEALRIRWPKHDQEEITKKRTLFVGIESNSKSKCLGSRIAWESFSKSKRRDAWIRFCKKSANDWNPQWLLWTMECAFSNPPPRPFDGLSALDET